MAIVDAATLLVHLGDSTKPRPVRLGLAAELRNYASETGHPMAHLTVEEFLDVSEVARAAVDGDAVVVFAEPETALDRLLPGMPDDEREVRRLDGDATGWIVELAPGVTAVYPYIPEEGTVPLFRRRRPTAEEMERSLADLDARARPPKPAKPKPLPTVTAAPVIEEPERPHADGCIDCGTFDFAVTWVDGMEEWTEERRMGGRCHRCHEERLMGGETAVRILGFRSILGRRGLPMDWDRLRIPLFAEHPDVAPTAEPWGWVDREASIREAMKMWPSGWPKHLHHLLPEREAPPAPAPPRPRPCRWCGEATTDRSPTGKVECQRCAADAAGRVDHLPLGRLEAVVGLAPLGGYDVERLGIEWFEGTDLTEPASKPFEWVDVRDVHRRAVRSPSRRDRFLSLKARDTAERREVVDQARREVRR